MSAISELKLDGSTPSKTSSTTTDPQPMLGLSYLSDLHDLDFSGGAELCGCDNLRNVTFSENADFGSSAEGYDFTFKAPKAEAPTQSSASSKLPPSPANSADGCSLSKASQTPDTKSSILPSVGLATPPSPLRELKGQVEAAAQTSSPRKRSREEMEEQFDTAASLLEQTPSTKTTATPNIITTTAAATTTVTETTAAPDSPRPRKRRFLQRFGFTAGVVVGAAGMFGTLLMLGEE